MRNTNRRVPLTRVRPSDKCGHVPGKWVAQYKEGDLWFDIGDPRGDIMDAFAAVNDYEREKHNALGH